MRSGTREKRGLVTPGRSRLSTLIEPRVIIIGRLHFQRSPKHYLPVWPKVHFDGLKCRRTAEEVYLRVFGSFFEGSQSLQFLIQVFEIWYRICLDRFTGLKIRRFVSQQDRIEMSRPQDPHRPLFPFGNPFKMMLPKGSYLSPRLLALLNTFEESLGGRFRMLKPRDKEDVLSLSWMRFAVELLCETHTDIKTIITELELPVNDWDDKWIDVYLDNSVKLLDICNAFSSEFSRINQGHLLLQCALHDLDACPSKNKFERACSSLDAWRQLISSKNRRIENCLSILDSLIDTLNLPKVKNSAKGKVLMRAMYGVKVLTVFVCSVFVSAFSGSAKKLVDLQVPQTCLWAEDFANVQSFINGEIRAIFSSERVTVLKELEAVDTSVKKLHTVIRNGVDPTEAEVLQNSLSDLGNMEDKLSQGLDRLAMQVDGFFQILLKGRDALLSNLRLSSIPDSKQEINKVDRQVVR